MALMTWRLTLFWVISASWSPGSRSERHPLCQTRYNRQPQEATGATEATAWRVHRGQRELVPGQAGDLEINEWISCQDYYGVSSVAVHADDLFGSPLHRALERSLQFDAEEKGLGLSGGTALRKATSPTSPNRSSKGRRMQPAEHDRRLEMLTSAADVGEEEGVSLQQQPPNSLVHAPNTNCDDVWLSWPAMHKRAIAEGTVLVFDVFSSVGNLFIAVENGMKLARLLDLGLVLTWANFPGFREAFDPAAIDWTVDPSPFMQATIEMEAGDQAQTRYSMVFDNYAMVLSESQVDLLASMLGVTKPSTKDLVSHFREAFPQRFRAFTGTIMREPLQENTSFRTPPCAWNMLLSRSPSMMANMKEHSPWPLPTGIAATGPRPHPEEYIAWHIRTTDGETALSYNPAAHPYIIWEPASDVCPTFMVAMEDAIQAASKCRAPYGWDTDVMPVYISSNSKLMAKDCTAEAVNHDMVMGHVDLGLSQSDAHTKYSQNPQLTAVSAFLDFLFLMDSKVIVRTGSSFSGTVVAIKGLRCHTKAYNSLPNRDLYLCIPADC